MAFPGDRKAKLGGTPRIGEILVAAGKITPEQLEEALCAQKEAGETLGAVLLSLGYVGRADLANALAERHRLEYVEITERDVDPQAATLVDRRVLRKYGALPLRVENGRLVVAMSDPTNLYAVEDLSMLSGRSIRPVVAVEDDIRRVFDRCCP